MLKKLWLRITWRWKTSNTIAYILLMLFSVVFLLGSLFVSMDSKWFVVLSAIGCSGIVSVIVAWLIELSNKRIQKNYEEKITEQLLYSYDLHVKCELQRALMCCAKKQECDLDKEYTIIEIHDLLDSIDCEDVYFKGFPIQLEKAIQNLSSIKFVELQKNDMGLKLCSLFDVLPSYVNEMNKLVEEEWGQELLKILVLSTLHVFNEINDIRNKNLKYALSKETINYLHSLRETKHRLKGD